MAKAKIGFLGVGFMGQLAHLQNYAALDTCEIVGVTDAKIEQARIVAEAYRIPKVYANAEELLADPNVEAVVSSQPFDNHVNIAKMVLNAGKHLLTEKPVCVYPENGHKIAEYAKKNGKIHMIANHKRSDLATEYAMGVIGEWKKSGRLGKIKYIRLTMPPGDWVSGATGVNKPIRTDEAYASFTREATPEGIDADTANKYVAFVNYYIHQVNLMRYLLGEDFKLTHADRTGVMLSVESPSGVCGIIEMATYSTSDSWQESAMVCFDRGYVYLTLPAPLASQRAGEVTVFTDEHGKGGIYTSPVLPNVSAMRNQAKNFTRAVAGEIEPPCPSSEAVKDLEFAMEYINAMKLYK
ncbi:MAG: Gfo/Idh/MocA family oxidoreductase [Defluviitaleaceae bacterium]|nr:Gfo/Idh/MocA family oxidoreductase [Defluviitaleaceae bacterium]